MQNIPGSDSSTEGPTTDASTQDANAAAPDAAHFSSDANIVVPDADVADAKIPDATLPDAARTPDASSGNYGVCGTSCDPYNNVGCPSGQYCAAWDGLSTAGEPKEDQPKTRCYPVEGTAGPWHIDSCTNGPTDDASQRCPTGYVCTSLGCFRNCRTSVDCGPGTGPDNYIRCDFTSFGEANCLPHCARKEG